MPNQTILIKPASGYCNMNCKYCFYHDVMDHREKGNYGFMTIETLEEIVRKAFMYAQDYVGFAFQGGEPTLVGIEFYEAFIQLEQKYNHNKIMVGHFLQTNGIIIDENWAIFFQKHNFLIGLSMDGPSEIHDKNRVDLKGVGTHSRVQKAAKLLNKYKVEYNILTVVTRNIARHPKQVYQFLKKNGFNYMQFIPCIDDFEKVPGMEKFSLKTEDYGNFLCNLFDLWYIDVKKGAGVSIRMFDNILQMLLGYAPESCDMAGVCTVNSVIEADGSVYPCDFYALDEWKLGMIQEEGFEKLKTKTNGIEFIKCSMDKSQECRHCRYLKLCRTGCRRYYINNNGKYINYFCEAYKQFYSYTLERFLEIGSLVKQQKQLM